jgi:predicted anti-sigma-YlaC factor YlaD
MTCEKFEVLYCDYLDGALDAAGRKSVESHLDSCAACTALAKDIKGTLAFLEKVPGVEAPPELVTRILFHTPETGPGKNAGSLRPMGWLTSWMGPMLQPKLAMGMAMTILSFSLIGRMAGLPQRQLTAEDLNPVRVWTSVEVKVGRTWDRAVKYYENLRLVYEIQSRLREWSEQEELARRNESDAATIDATPESERNDGERSRSQ